MGWRSVYLGRRRNPLEGLNIMTSAINSAYPVEGNPTTESVRDNFESAKTEIEALQSGKQDKLISGSTIKTVAGKSVVGSGNVAITKEDVGLPNVDNTSDANKPVSTAQAAAISAAQTAAIASANDYTDDELAAHVAADNPHEQYALAEYDGDTLIGFKNKNGTEASVGGVSQQLPHLVGIPAGNLGASTSTVTVDKAYVFSSASISSGVLNIAAKPNPSKTTQLGAGGFPLDPLGDGIGAMIFDTGNTIPFGTYISSYGSGGTKSADIGNYNLTNFFGTAIPNVASGSTIYAAACYNATTNYLLTHDCNLHQCTFTNARFQQGSFTSGNSADLPVTNELRVYAYYEFVANDGVNTKVTIQATFDGQPYLIMPANVIVKKKCDPVFYPAYADQIVSVKYFVLNNDLKGSAFTIPGYNATVDALWTGLQEGILYGASNFCKKLTSDTNYWGGVYKQSANQYRPFSFIAGTVETNNIPEVFIAGDSITSKESISVSTALVPFSPINWLTKILKDAGLPYTNMAKGGEAQFNWPMNVAARQSGVAGNIFICALATNGGAKGVAGATDILAVVKQARAFGYKRVVVITSTLQTSTAVQISSSSITGNVLTVSGFTTGAEVPVGARLTTGSGLQLGITVSAKIDATHYTVTNFDGSPYTGGDKTGVTIDPFAAEVTQTSNVNHVLMNQTILSWPSGGIYPDAVLDVWAASRSPVDPSKWAPYVSQDGVHPWNATPSGVTGTQHILNYAEANNWTELITG